jgi:hypothetical protein
LAKLPCASAQGSASSRFVIDATHLGQLKAQQLRETVLSLTCAMETQAAEEERKDLEIAFK